MTMKTMCDIMNKLTDGKQEKTLTINTAARLFIVKKKDIQIEDGFLMIRLYDGLYDKYTEKACIPFERVEYIGTNYSA